MRCVEMGQYAAFALAEGAWSILVSYQVFGMIFESWKTVFAYDKTFWPAAGQ